MADLNNCSIVGRLTADAEKKNVGANGTTLVTFTVANNTGFGQYECTNFFRVNAWGKQAESVFQYLKKGKQVALSGAMENKKWTGQDGTTHDAWTITTQAAIQLLADPKGVSSSPAYEEPPVDEAVF